MKKLLKEYEFTSHEQYWQMCKESFINGQLKQAADQFGAMPRIYRKGMVKYIVNEWDIAESKATLFFIDRI